MIIGMSLPIRFVSVFFFFFLVLFCYSFFFVHSFILYFVEALHRNLWMMDILDIFNHVGMCQNLFRSEEFPTKHIATND